MILLYLYAFICYTFLSEHCIFPNVLSLAAHVFISYFTCHYRIAPNFFLLPTQNTPSILIPLPLLHLPGVPQCWIEFSEAWQWQVYMSIVALTVVICPTVIITACYTVIVYTIWSKGRVMTVRTKAIVRSEYRYWTDTYVCVE